MLVMLLGQSRVFYSMAHDGLLWKWAGDIHPRFRTPWKSTAIVGVLRRVCWRRWCQSAHLGQLVSIGTLLAFVIVCAGVWVSAGQAARSGRGHLRHHGFRSFRSWGF